MTTLLSQLVDAMDAADEYNAGRRARVKIVLSRGCMIARAVECDGEKISLLKPMERMISLDMLEASRWSGTARQIVDDAVNAL